MVSLVIRRATTKDIPSIVRIRLTTLTEEETVGFSAPLQAATTSIKKLQEAWSEGNRLKNGFEVFLAEVGNCLAGYAMFGLVNGCTDCGYIDDIVVAKEQQGKGIGKALVGYLEGIAKSKGCSVMKTDTTENADGVAWRSYGFWIKMGYKDTGERLPTHFSFHEIPFTRRLE